LSEISRTGKCTNGKQTSGFQGQSEGRRYRDSSMAIRIIYGGLSVLEVYMGEGCTVFRY
jgi:hypothetical protein